MIRPWQIWLAYVVALLVVAPAMLLLTQRALELDRAEAEARGAAAQESRIGSALWRMDTLLTRILAPEIGRPYYVYEPSYATGVKGSPAQSPLMTLQSRFVKLHFQVDQQDQWCSPQCPADGRIGQPPIELPELQTHRDRLTQLSVALQCSVLSACLPNERVESVAGPTPQADDFVGAVDPDAQASQRGAPWQQVYNYGDGLAQQSQAPPSPQSVPSAFPQTSPSQAGKQLRENVAINASDLFSRNQTLQAEAARQRYDQLGNWTSNQSAAVQEGISQPVWIDDKLLIARRVWIGEHEVVQGCWLDWDEIRRELKQRVVDLLPDIELAPAFDMQVVSVNRVLATLPAQLVVAAPIVELPLWSPIRGALMAAWSFLLLAAAGVAWLLLTVVGLSERRAAFVSAVTHELRTPLTTFQMYSEMLAQDMIADPERRTVYLNTLQSESHRLSHLVENVLLYARLERAHWSQRLTAVGMHDLLERTTQRLKARAAEASRQLRVRNLLSPDDEHLQALTDPGAVEQILFNLVDNACKYALPAQDPSLLLTVARDRRHLLIRVADDGPGLAPVMRRTLFRPFSKSAEQAAESAPGVGLGLALSRRLARQLKGDLRLLEAGQGLSDCGLRGAVFELRLPLALDQRGHA